MSADKSAAATTRTAILVDTSKYLVQEARAMLSPFANQSSFFVNVGHVLFSGRTAIVRALSSP